MIIIVSPQSVPRVLPAPHLPGALVDPACCAYHRGCTDTVLQDGLIAGLRRRDGRPVYLRGGVGGTGGP